MKETELVLRRCKMSTMLHSQITPMQKASRQQSLNYDGFPGYNGNWHAEAG